MRSQILLALPLLAAPLAAQQRVIAPAASVLFATTPQAAVQDTIAVDDGMPQGEGAFLGFLGGAGIAFLITRLDFNPGDPTCNTTPCATGHDDNKGSVLMFTAAGAVAGMFLGSHLARPRHTAPIDVGPANDRSTSRGASALSIVGGALGAAGGYYLVANGVSGGPCPDAPGSSCGNGEASLGWKLGGTVVGGAAGYLVGRGLSGRWSRRPPPNEATVESPREDRGMKWWQGAVTGGLLGGVGTPMLAKVLRLDEQGDGVPAVAFAPVGALLGLVVGGSLAQAH